MFKLKARNYEVGSTSDFTLVECNDINILRRIIMEVSDDYLYITFPYDIDYDDLYIEREDMK